MVLPSSGAARLADIEASGGYRTNLDSPVYTTSHPHPHPVPAVGSSTVPCVKSGLVRVRNTDAGPIVLVPLLGATWLGRGQPYWTRRVAVAAAIIAATALAVTLSVLFTKALDRSGTLPSEIVAGCYVLTAVAGMAGGYRWGKRTPTVRPRSGGQVYGPMSLLFFLFMPYLAGMGLVVASGLFRSHFPGEQRAAALTDKLRA